MNTPLATALLTAALAAATMPAQAAGWGDTLREGASRLGSGSGDNSSPGLGGLAGNSGGAAAGAGGLAALGLGGLSSPGTAGNAAGVITYCMKNNYLNADKAAQVKDQLLGKMGLGQKEAPQDSGYQSGLGGMVQGANGQSFSLDKIKGNLKEKACDFVLNNAKSLI